VHHGSQEKYINKNYGATFIIWDRIFGTYQEEEEQVIYGITRNIDHKHDPIHINFHEYVDIIKDVKSADSLKEKFFYIFGDPEEIGKYKKKKEGGKSQDHPDPSLQTKEARVIALKPTKQQETLQAEKENAASQ